MGDTMKTLNKYFRIVLCFVAFALCSFLFAFAPTLTAYAALDFTAMNYNVAINSIKMPRTTVDVSKGEKLEIPLLDLNNTANSKYNNNYTTCKIRVSDKSGYVHEFVDNISDRTQNASDEYFTYDSSEQKLSVSALNEGTYSIVYVLDDVYYSNSYKVEVTNAQYEIEFKKGDNGEKVLVKQDVAVGDEVVLPIGAIKGREDEAKITITNNAHASFVATKNAENTAYTFTPTEEGIYTVKYSYNYGSNKPSETIEINVKSAEEYSAPTEFELVSTPTFPSMELGQTEIQLPELTFKSEYRTGFDYNLTSIKITKKNNSAISYELNADDLMNNYTFDFTKENFGASSYEDMVGAYTITYSVVDAYGRTHTTKAFDTAEIKANSNPKVYMTYDYEIEEVGGVKTIKEDTLDTDTVYDLKSRYDASAGVIVPAIYGSDLVTDYFDSDNFFLVRYIRSASSSSTYYYVDNLRYDATTQSMVAVEEGDAGYNYSGDENIGKFNKAVAFKSNVDLKDGTYYLEYRVISKVLPKGTTLRKTYLYKSGTTQYSFEVKGNITSEDKTTPTIQLTGVKKNASVLDTMNITTTVNDATNINVKTNLFYYTSNSGSLTLQDAVTKVLTLSEVEDIATSEMVALDLEHDFTSHKLFNKKFVEGMRALGFDNFTMIDFDDELSAYTLEIPESVSDKLTVVGIALNEFDNFAISSQDVTINNTTETNAPTFVIKTENNESTDGVAEGTYENSLFEDDGTPITTHFNQTDIIKLPVVAFNDGETDKSDLKQNIMYYIIEADGTKSINLDPKNYDYIGGTIYGGTIQASTAGTYYVVYSSTDNAGNTSVVYFTFVVDKLVEPAISVTTYVNDSAKSATSLTVDAGAVISFETILNYGDEKFDEVNEPSVVRFGESASFEKLGKMQYRLNGEGTYTFKFTASHAGKGATEKTITITVNNVALTWDSNAKSLLNTINLIANKESEIILPVLSTNKDGVEAIPVVKSNKTTDPIEVTRKIVGGNDVWAFTTTDAETASYTVEYTATSNGTKISSTSLKTIEIKVGDAIPPVITVNENVKAKLSQDIVYDGSNEIEYKITIVRTGANKSVKISAISNGKQIYGDVIDLGVALSDKSSTGTVSNLNAWSNLKAELSSATKDTNSTDDEIIYTISSVGKYVLTLSTTDANANVATPVTIEFNVKAQSTPTEKNDNVAGIVLIVVSVVILVGVIAFFLFTGKKGGSKGRKNKKTSENSIEETSSDEQNIVIEDENKNE